MRGFVCVLVCVAALAANCQAQWQGRPQPPFGRPGQPGGRQPGGGGQQPGVGGQQPGGQQPGGGGQQPGVGGQQPGVGGQQPGVGGQQPGGRQPGVGGQQPGGRQPGFGVPGRPGGGQPGWGQPGFGQPGAGQPGRPGAGWPGAGGPGAGGPGAGGPGAGGPGAGRPGAGWPGAGGPGAGWPGAGGPGAGGPGAGRPGAGWPGAGPGTGWPGAGRPGAGWPGAGRPGAGWPGQGQPGFPGPGGPIEPFKPDPNRKERCAKFWMEEGNSCYLYDSGAFLRRVAANTPIIVNNQDGLVQTAANNYCAQMHPNASLVTVNNLQENNFLYEWAIRMMVEPQPVWIGLHVGPMGQWQWYSGEPINYTNWEEMMAPMPAPGLGAMIFDADIINQIYNNQVEITPQWVPEHGRNEPHALICEYHPVDLLATDVPPTTMRPFTRAPGPRVPGPRVPGRRPAMVNSNPVNLLNLLSGGGFGGSRLHEVPRSQHDRPANYNMNPYYAVQP